MTLRREQQLVSPVPLFLCWLVMTETLDADIYHCWCWCAMRGGGRVSPTAFFAARRRVVSRAASRAALLAQRTRGKNARSPRQRWWRGRRSPLLSPLSALCLPNLSIRPPRSATSQPLQPALHILFLLCRALFVMPGMIIARLHPAG